MAPAASRTFAGTAMLLVAIASLALAACDEKPVTPDPGGGNGGGGGPTGPGPVVTTGTISGTVTVAGTGVTNARIVLGTTTSVMTAASGQYTLADVPAGTQSVTLAQPRQFNLAPGETATKNTTVTAGQTSTVNWTLVPAPIELPPVTWVVSLLASSFSPSSVTIARGDTVQWTNLVPIFHTITPDNRNQPGTWRTENMTRGGDTFSHVFDTQGTFSYSCTIHAGMAGVVRVR